MSERARVFAGQIKIVNQLEPSYCNGIGVSRDAKGFYYVDPLIDVEQRKENWSIDNSNPRVEDPLSPATLRLSKLRGEKPVVRFGCVEAISLPERAVLNPLTYLARSRAKYSPYWGPASYGLIGILTNNGVSSLEIENQIGELKKVNEDEDERGLALLFFAALGDKAILGSGENECHFHLDRTHGVIFGSDSEALAEAKQMRDERLERISEQVRGVFVSSFGVELFNNQG